MMRVYRTTVTAIMLASVLLVSACGSGSSGSKSTSTATSASSSSAGGSAGIAAAKAAVAAAVIVPKTIPETVSVSKKPPTGIKIALLISSTPAAAGEAPPFTQAAEALGWKPTVITYNPATPGAAVQQAIDAGNKYIGMSAIEFNTITSQAASAKAKGIDLFIYSDPEAVAEGPANGLYGAAGGAANGENQGRALADYMIANSDGHADAVNVTLPIYPILADSSNAARAEFRKNCSACSLQTLAVNATQVGGGQVPSVVVTYLKSHPKVNYVYLAFGDLFAGVTQALQTADLSNRVKIVGAEGETAAMQSVIKGTSSAWVVIPESYPTAVMLDWMVRLSVGDQITAASKAEGDALDQYLVTSPAEAKATLAAMPDGYWPGPSGFLAQFEKLWKV